ncbi:MAG: ATP-binding protein [Candidatus Binataceae bacterium]
MKQVGDQSPGLAPVRVSSVKGVFARSGEIWTLGSGGPTFALKDVKGLSYIQRLLQHPGQEFHAFDILRDPADAEPGTDKSALLADATISIGGLGDAGEMLDARAKEDYRRKLRELREELEEHRARGNAERAQKIETDIDFIVREISRAVGLGGRDRRAGSAAERARLNVTRAIKTALQKISEHDDKLRELLERHIRTGVFCRYTLDVEAPIDWKFSIDDRAPAPALSESKPDPPYLRPAGTDLVDGLDERTTFVGRDSERAVLARFLEQARNGEGKIVLIAGAAGVGKTRIAAELAADALQQRMLTLAGSCYDRDDPVPFLPFVEILEASIAQTRDLVAFRKALGDDAGEVARLVPQLRRLFPDIPPAMELPPEQSRRILFTAVTDLVARVARNTPLVLVLDDLQWADEGTLLLLSHLARFASQIPVLVVGTYRDFDLNPAGILTRTISELTRLRLVHRITLGGLDESAVAEMLRALSGREAPQPVVRLFHADTDGNPFFVEELFRYLVEQGKLLDSKGEYRNNVSVSDFDVPQGVRMVIGRRLARLTADTLKILCTAAVIGRSFTFELLAASIQADADSLLDSIEEAESAGLISSTVEYPEARFRFSHELTRQTVISQVSVARRQHLHLDIASALESLNANALDEVANDLAHHLFQAGAAADGSKTIRFLSMAAKRARLQGALAEAAEFYRDALMVLKRMPESHERDRLELGLQLGVGAALMATRGYAYADTAAAYQRATSLGERLGDPVQVVLALTGLASQPLLRGELDTAQLLADQVLAVSQRDGKSKTMIWGHYIQGVVLYHRGNLGSAWEHLSQADAEYREEEHKKNPQDPGSESLEYLALAAWQLGMADTARAHIREAISLNERIQKPYARTHCNFYAAYLYAMMRDPVATQEFAERAVNLAAERSIPLFMDAGRILYGWAITQQGRYAEGVACARAAVESFKAAGNRLGIGSYLGFLAEALFSAGLPDEATAAVEEALDLAPPQSADMSYLWWLQGKLLLESARPEGTPQILSRDEHRFEDAAASFRKAVSLALSIGAKSYAIRSMTSLGTLLAARDRTVEAREMLDPLLTSITEGFDTPDLADAQQLMEELG